MGGRRAPPLPGAEKGGLSAPQPRHWRSVAKQDREWQLRQDGRNTQLTVCTSLRRQTFFPCRECKESPAQSAFLCSAKEKRQKKRRKGGEDSVFFPSLDPPYLKRLRGSADPRWIPRGAMGRWCKTSPPAPCSAKRSVSARKQGRQLFPRLHPVLGTSRTSAGTGSKLVSGKPACKRPFLSYTGRGAVFLFGQAPKRKIGGRITQITVCIPVRKTDSCAMTG